MGKRDYRHHEPKKTKKATKKPASPLVLPSSTLVEVVKRPRKEKEEE